MELRRENICTHVTALKVFANILFVGEGNQVSVFNWKTKALLKKIIVFRASFIHGIKIGNADKALLFGGKSFRVYTLCFNLECDTRWVITKILQPLDLTIIRIFKHKLQKQWEEWIRSGPHSFTKSGRMRTDSYEKIALWVDKAWQSV
ncbi:uncharacterized protein LOC118188010 [Stegodyphus dumicola]|uniref:uncharacterized protein LOC118188010 n=1 Tax=Stegodyphus dumicola TaxID=202533 RepID=UPI0015B13C8A|nr:uncharacterized protein LOC118188010 [Stegodyphus dumicola]